MSLKRVNKSKDSEEKTIKKKTVSSAKTKDDSAKKIVKKAVAPSAKKTVRTKVVSKKTESKSDTKTVRTKAAKVSSSEKKIIKKINVEEKTRRRAKRVIKENPVMKKEDVSKEQHVVVADHLRSIVKAPSETKVDKQKEKPIVVLSEKVVVEQKLAEQRQFVAKSEELKVAIETGSPKQDLNENKFKSTILINELVTVRELADKMRLSVCDVLKKLLSMGSLATINQRLDADTAILLAGEFGYDAKMDSIYAGEKIGSIKEEDPTKLKQRPPVVTIMGHVDHGKTSLLDSIRSSNVIAGEHGGITQHIGAYKVKTSSGQFISFLDTPGHEAFTAMRSRGAQATDIIVLVVSATDGVMPQTVEAINHAKAANVPIIVAVNKIDMPGADSQKIRQELSNYGLISEEWGGDTIMVDISAKQKINIDSLLEMILLKAEMMELKANPDKNAEGIVIEARLDSRKGTIATFLVQGGTLKIGDNLVVGTTYGKVRAMADEHGKRFDTALPSTPAGILGINEPPQAGDKFLVVENEAKAREVAESRKLKAKETSLKPRHHLSLADINMGQAKDLRIILKTDVQGSLGALGDALERLSTSEISLKIIHRDAGAITKSDVALAVASDALIVGFNLRPDAVVEKLAEVEKVSINVYRVIYDLIADVKAAMEGLLDPDTKEKILGKAVVKQVFRLSTHGTISGCSVVDGKIQRGAKVRLLRDNVIVFEGNISSLKRFKDDVKEVEKDYECGIGLENFSDIKAGDVIENFTFEKVARKLENN
ncbi:MAG: translation initiation factor IF-2 [Endomicrobium sp.]|uniref:translation initiation factor IF-2 n=1 Tax=Candidatus Endomicrobiellum pyrsonymphae TaxID=1408203 RepID=UPI00357D09EF|nr:translation initiation factor IF-2 [Endomicrobium sp.]